VEKVDAAFFAPVPHPDRLLAMLRPLAGRDARTAPGDDSR
jgi:hypothetical protein